MSLRMWVVVLWDRAIGRSMVLRDRAIVDYFGVGTRHCRLLFCHIGDDCIRSGDRAIDDFVRSGDRLFWGRDTALPSPLMQRLGWLCAINFGDGGYVLCAKKFGDGRNSDTAEIRRRQKFGDGRNSETAEIRRRQKFGDGRNSETAEIRRRQCRVPTDVGDGLMFGEEIRRRQCRVPTNVGGDGLMFGEEIRRRQCRVPTDVGGDV